jgi:glutaredoxin 3
MHKVTIYTAPLCPYCHMAKELLRAKGVMFEEINVCANAGRRAEMCAKSQGRDSVPQIWIGETFVGGCAELNGLDRAGKLDMLLGAG